MASPRMLRLWTEVGRIAGRLDRDAGDAAAVRKLATQLRALVQEAQRADPADDRLRRNPLVTYLNPPRRKIFGAHVLALLYQHADDGDLYVHGFGNREVVARQEGDRVTLTGVPARTNVLLERQPDGTVLLKHKDGRRLWEEFDV